VNDRGPYAKGRIIDLSHGAAKRIGMNDIARVEVEYLGQANSSSLKKGFFQKTFLS
jgi:rare lipoprotein A